MRAVLCCVVVSGSSSYHDMWRNFVCFPDSSLRWPRALALVISSTSFLLHFLCHLHVCHFNRPRSIVDAKKILELVLSFSLFGVRKVPRRRKRHCGLTQGPCPEAIERNHHSPPICVMNRMCERVSYPRTNVLIATYHVTL